MQLLAVNTGSSSVRLAVFELIGSKIIAHQRAHYPMMIGDELDVLRGMVSADSGPPPIVVHRVVHGGEHFTEACRIDARVEQEIERLAPLAPLHNPTALRWIRAAREAFGEEVAQVAVFDTAFYTALPAVAATYALPRYLCQGKGLRRYGFHGFAHRAMWNAWRSIEPAASGNRVISFQLGSGSSVTAIQNGQAMDTSMGFSPLEGLVMATRAGDIDPGLILYLQTEIGLSPNDIETMLNRESGLLGVSGFSGDMRELLASNDPTAEFAIDIYCYRARKYLGAYMAALGGVDAILFGGGIGENCPEIRHRILGNMAYSGIVLCDRANTRVSGLSGRISTDDSRIGVYVVPVDEQALLAEEVAQMLERVSKTGSRINSGR